MKIPYISVNPMGHSQITKAAQAIGKHKIPRYLYHLTNVENYQQILSSGSIKPSGHRLPDGIYMIELDSFVKYWSKRLKNALCFHCLRGSESEELVLLKIPTKNLEPENLKIRSQENACSSGKLVQEAKKWFEARKYLFNYLKDKYGIHQALEKLSETSPKEFFPVIKGEDAKLSSLLKQRKKPLEYIFKGEIPMSEVEYIGSYTCPPPSETNITIDKIKSSDFCKNVFEKLFKHRPEKNCLKAWRDNLN